MRVLTSSVAIAVRAAAFGIALAVEVSGCGSSVADCQFRCSANGACPADTTCSGGYCRTTTQGTCAAGAVIDAPSQRDAAICPATYTETVPSSASYYRIVPSDVWWNTEHACEVDAPGATHLVVFETTAEAADISSKVSGQMFFVGAVQAKDQSTPAAGWSWLTGAAVAPTAWVAGQPDDGTGTSLTELNQQNLASFDGVAGGLTDFDSASSGSPRLVGVCECDGAAVDATIRAQIPPDPT